MKCPCCNSSRFKEGPNGKVCLKCGFRNDPNYNKNKIETFKKDYSLIIVEDSK